MSTKELAVILLLGHISSVVFIVMVLYRQLRILRGRPDSTLRIARIVLSTLAGTILVGNFIPITVDSLVLADVVVRNQPSAAGIVYATSNVVILVLSSASMLALYVIAEILARKDPN